MPTAFITGGSRGIGAAAVKKFYDNGYDVAFGYHNCEAAAKALCDSLTGVSALRADMCEPKEIEQLCAQAQQRLGHIDTLVLNAGIALPQKLITDVSLEEWDKLFATNLRSAFLCCKALLPSMIARGEGSIITIASMWGEVGASCEVAYSAVKAGVIGLTKSLAKEVGPSGIRVNCISPGVVSTDMNSHLSCDDMAALCEETPLGKIAAPSQIADAIYMLASQNASFITGQVLGVNGGFVI